MTYEEFCKSEGLEMTPAEKKHTKQASTMWRMTSRHVSGFRHVSEMKKDFFSDCKKQRIM